MNNYTFNIKDAQMLANLAGLAYHKFENDYHGFAMDLSARGFKILKTFDNKHTNTQGFLAANDSCAILCFRGTFDIPGDIFTDVRGKLIDDCHEGFFNAFESVKNDVVAALALTGNKPLFCTGHSLGGALAKTAILQLPEYNWRACYTFGSPPICTEAKAAHNKVPTFLIVNCGDMVPRVMDLEVLGGFGSLLIAGLNIFLKKHKSKLNLDETELYARTMSEDMKKYVHFGEIRFFDTNGLSPNQTDSLLLFKQTVTSNLLRAIEDHKMDLYIANINKHINLAIIVDTSDIET